MMRCFCIDSKTSALKGRSWLVVSNSDFSGIKMNANKKNIEIAKKLLSCLKCDKSRPIRDII